MNTEKAKIIKRTFEAAQYPKGSEQRKSLNCDSATSEYMISYRYLVRSLAFMSDGSPNPVQKYHDSTFRTKREAQIYLEQIQEIA